MSGASSTNEEAQIAELAGKISLADDAPEVNYEILVVENQGLAVAVDGAQGRVTIASRPLDESFSRILCEKPAIICTSNDHMEFMERFLEAPIDIQVGILDMFYQPLDSPMGYSLLEPAKVLYILRVLDDVHLIHQLLTIYATNSYQYLGQELSALPIFGSKISHSCHPNLAYSSLSGPAGTIEYFLLRPVRKGQIVSTSYLADLYETPTSERNFILYRTKFFLCECERCARPDDCRRVRCPACRASGGVISWIGSRYSMDTMDPEWHCSACDTDLTQHALRRETEMNEALQEIDKTLKRLRGFNTSPDYSCDDLVDLIRECRRDLSPTHHLTSKACRLLLNLSTTFAYVRTKQLVVRGIAVENDPRAANLFRCSVNAGILLVSACECVAADCPGCGLVSQSDFVESLSTERHEKAFGGTPTSLWNHEPVYDQTVAMHHVCDNLLMMEAQFWPPYAVSIIERYWPLLKIKFGMERMKEFEMKIVAPWIKLATCTECKLR